MKIGSTEPNPNEIPSPNVRPVSISKTKTNVKIDAEKDEPGKQPNMLPKGKYRPPSPPDVKNRVPKILNSKVNRNRKPNPAPVVPRLNEAPKDTVMTLN